MSSLQQPHQETDTFKAKSIMLKLENTEKRDALIAIERKYQAQWAQEKLFQVDAPSIEDVPFKSVPAAELRNRFPKFFGTMAYPYMNGSLHAGHSFTASKIEFTTGFARMQGKRALFPLGFHCTGLPIKACADKLVREVAMFGTEFEGYSEDAATEELPNPAPAQNQTRVDVTKFTAKKGKVAAKTVKSKYQFQIMLTLGIPRSEIHRFADPQYWLTYFPPLCERDLTNFGARIDWRRSFVTTDANPYYDAFIRWQMNRLKDLEKIRFGSRYTIYSPKDGQPCMDHDRSDGEGVGPQPYTAIKLKVLEWAPEAAKLIESKIPNGANVYFVAATLRPETMYGQTCCFVGPTIEYGVFKVSESEYYVITERAARNMAFQGVFSETGVYKKLVDIPGSSLIGTLVNAPLSVHHQGVRILPMETVKATKGTGVVTSVPSDSPDDYATVADLSKKADYYKIKKEWAELEIVPIIWTPTYGDLTAPAVVKLLKINSPKDIKPLAEAKDLAYKEGFYQGIMTIGEFKGDKVQDAKEKVKQVLIKSRDAFDYSEPENLVVSRSGDECVVALMDQWFLNYGENDPSWRDQALSWVENGLNTYTAETKNGFEGTIKWLNQWACARTYGLGSKLPFDPSFLVESLSDSTIYMAYYTIAHLLHKDIFGKEPGVAGIKASQMTDEVWDFVFARRELTSDVLKSQISKENLECMRREFEYWYPLDMRVSGKDLIPNHLTFFLYIHIALFPSEYWPRSIRANGHLMLNGEKMSKSTGNFLTLDDILKKYGADASRIALADAGDGVEDANFEETVANSSILRLYTLKEWCEEEVGRSDKLRKGPKDHFFDCLFENEMRSVVHEAKHHYENTMYKLALKSALYDFTSARDFYREATKAAGIEMHHDLVILYVELQALLLTPITPHWSDFIWLEVLKKPATIQNELFPSTPEADEGISAMREYIRATTSNITSAEAAQQKKKDKGKAAAFDPKKPKKLTIFAAKSYPVWQDKYIELMRESFDSVSLMVDDKDLNSKVAKMGEMKKAMPFVQNLKRRLQNGEKADVVFNRKLGFDEVEILKEMNTGLKKTTGCVSVEIIEVQDGGKSGIVISESGGESRVATNLPPMAESAIPGSPSLFFENVQ
ncbi:MAG: cytosolic leucyl tRNA synthetase [Trizodia sp. TS-e1964]|nr:MAG: cytosolic leucyl tRNA synthetase [Trizodia sp. TS-e1964]